MFDLNDRHPKEQAWIRLKKQGLDSRGSDQTQQEECILNRQGSDSTARDQTQLGRVPTQQAEIRLNRQRSDSRNGDQTQQTEIIINRQFRLKRQGSDSRGRVCMDQIQCTNTVLTGGFN